MERVTRVEDFEADALKFVGPFPCWSNDGSLLLKLSVQSAFHCGDSGEVFNRNASTNQRNELQFLSVHNGIRIVNAQEFVIPHHVENEEAESVEVVAVATDAGSDKLALHDDVLAKEAGRQIHPANSLTENRIFAGSNQPIPIRRNELPVMPAKAEAEPVQLFRRIPQRILMAFQQVAALVKLAFFRARDEWRSGCHVAKAYRSGIGLPLQKGGCFVCET